jgi:hypothetical protein
MNMMKILKPYLRIKSCYNALRYLRIINILTIKKKFFLKSNIDFITGIIKYLKIIDSKNTLLGARNKGYVCCRSNK